MERPALTPDGSLAWDSTVSRADLVVIDELGFAPLDDVGSQLLFRFVAAAYERRSLGIASHWPFEDWGRFLTEHSTALVLLDRLLHHAVTVVTSGESFRMGEARMRGGARHQRPKRPFWVGTFHGLRRGLLRGR
jgi:DNA replication protein DnaC